MRRLIHCTLRYAILIAILFCNLRVGAQDITLSSYNNQTSISTYKGGSIRLINGFNTAGHSVHIFISDEIPPVPNVPTALSNGQNYIATWTTTAPITDPEALITKPLKDVKLTVQYFDGLGRPIQTVIKQGSLVTATGESTDLVTTILNDGFDRNFSTLLPYAAGGTADGRFRSNGESEQVTWYGGGNSPVAEQNEPGINARTLTVFEASPLNRVTESYAPGKSWLGSYTTGPMSTHHSIKNKYWTNTATDNVKYWTVSLVTTAGTGFGNYTSPKPYAAGELYKSVKEDEQNRQVIEFKNKDGHIILRKVQLAKTDAGSGSAHSGWLCTYYLYDYLGKLRCVVQPEGVKLLEANSWNFTENILKEQCFRYEYDARNRMIMKQIPGAGPVYMVYDKRDRLVMTQDSVMRTSHKWLTTHYDELNRQDTTWLYTTTGSTTFNSILTAAATSDNYPTASPSQSTFLTETHYDNYTDVSVPTGMSTTFKQDWNSYFLPASTTTFPYAEQPKQNTAISTRGLVTWSRTRVLDSTLQLVTINIYDDRGRLVQTQSENITGGIDVSTTQYSWAGLPLVTVQKQQHGKGSTAQTTVVVTKMTYDDLGRMVKTEMKQSNSRIGNGSMLTNYATISEIGYDALGQAKEKKLGKRKSSATNYTAIPLETQEYDYNIRGWRLGMNREYVKDPNTTNTSATATTTTIASGEMFTESSMDIQSVTFPSKNFFGYDIGYDQRDNDRINHILYDSARFDGNITGMTWKGDNDKKIRKYDFGYDPASRLTGARFGQLTGATISKTTVNYDVSNLSYDANGNIMTMNQYGLKSSGSSAIIDQLTYTYRTASNKLAKVADQAPSTASDHLGDFQDGINSGDDYTYDGNGNIIGDQNKKISGIIYNVLNLPSVISIEGKGAIKYYYDASGKKLQKRTTDNTTSPSKITVTTYIGSAVYLNDTLQFFGTIEGRVRANSTKTAWIYDYFLEDHLGNTRMMITDDYSVSSPILEAYSYYPFGLQQKSIGLKASVIDQHNKYSFNGNEIQENEFNDGSELNVIDFNARFFNPQIGRFLQNDPFADIHGDYTSYAFSFNDPINSSDPFGMDTLIMYPEPGMYSTYIADGQENGPTYYYSVPQSALYSYNDFSHYYDVNRRSGYSDFDIYKNVSNIFPGMNSADYILYFKASDPGAVAYRAYIDEHSHQDQLFALGIFTSPLIITGLAESGLTVAQIYDGYNVAKSGKDLLEKSPGRPFSDDLVEEAQKLYPRKAGKIEKHHITPKYLGGDENGPLAPIDASYHQVITNEFRTYWGYGKEFPNDVELKDIMQKVYSKYPLPPGN